MLGYKKLLISHNSGIAKDAAPSSSVNSSFMISLPTAMTKLLLLYRKTNQNHRVMKNTH